MNGNGRTAAILGYRDLIKPTTDTPVIDGIVLDLCAYQPCKTPVHNHMAPLRALPHLANTGVMVIAPIGEQTEISVSMRRTVRYPTNKQCECADPRTANAV